MKLPQKILIHAASRSVRRNELYALYEQREICRGEYSLRRVSLELIPPDRESFSYSAIIGAIDFENYFLMTPEIIAQTSRVERACAKSAGESTLSRELCGLWLPGRWGWNCSNPILFDEPIPCKGQQLFWKPDVEVLALAQDWLLKFSPS